MDDEPVSLEHSKVIAELGIDIHKLEEIKKEVTAAMQAGMVI
jgi:hypothetical protein